MVDKKIMSVINWTRIKIDTNLPYVIVLVFNLRGLRVYMYMLTQMWRCFSTNVITKKSIFFPLKQVGERKFKINYNNLSKKKKNQL